MKWEKDNQVANLNGENNYKILDKSQKGTWQYTYNSSARNVVRMWWLSNFITQLFELLFNTDKSLVQCLQDSYVVAFKPFHPWIVAKAAGVAMYAAGSREGFYQLAGVKDQNDFKDALVNIRLVRDGLTKFLEENQLDKLP